MATQVELATQGILTEVMQKIAAEEGLEPELVRQRFAEGQIVAPLNSNRPGRIVGMGLGLRTKVNASIGTSSDICDLDAGTAQSAHREAEKAGADTLMELCAGGDLDLHPPGGSGGVPTCRWAMSPSTRLSAKPAAITAAPTSWIPRTLFDLIERQLADGMSFMAIHCGINLFTLERLRKPGLPLRRPGEQGRHLPGVLDGDQPPGEPALRAVRPGGGASWPSTTPCSPWATGVRAGAIHDSHDRAQMAEMVINCELAEIGPRAWAAR